MCPIHGQHSHSQGAMGPVTQSAFPGCNAPRHTVSIPGVQCAPSHSPHSQGAMRPIHGEFHSLLSGMFSWVRLGHTPRPPPFSFWSKNSTGHLCSAQYWVLSFHHYFNIIIAINWYFYEDMSCFCSLFGHSSLMFISGGFIYNSFLNWPLISKYFNYGFMTGTMA